MRSKLKESETLELKKSTSQLKSAIISIVAILNKHQKGELYFGIKNDGTVIGQDVNEKTLRDVSKSISDHIEPRIYPKLEKVKIKGKTCIHVAFSGKEIPYFAYGRAYTRVGDEDKQLSAKELENIILKKNQDKLRWDNRFSEKTINDVNAKQVKEYIKRANAAKRISFKFTNVADTLAKLGLIKNGKLLNAAEVLFCDRNNLKVQVAVFAGIDKLTFLDIGQYEGNIFTLLKKSESYIKEHMNWRAEMKEMQRKEIPEIPVRAIN